MLRSPIVTLATVEPPFLIEPRQYADWLGEAWLQVLENPDKTSLEKIQKQPELF